MHRIRRRALALLTALVCLMPVHLKASASQDPLLDFIKTVAPGALNETIAAATPAPAQAESAASEPATQVTATKKPSPESVLTESIAQRWDRSPKLIHEIMGYVSEYAYDDFPKPVHILAIMAIESSFNPKASSRGNVGLMQINLAANGKKLRNRGLRENVRVGAELLHEYYLLLRCNHRAAVLSYNAGIGNYLKGRYDSRYWRKYQRELARFSVKH